MIISQSKAPNLLDSLTVNIKGADIETGKVVKLRAERRPPVRPEYCRTSEEGGTTVVPIWQKALQHKKYKERPGRVKRFIALRVCSAYCTLSTVALQMVGILVPIDLIVEERARAHQQGPGSANTSEHTMFRCARWVAARMEAEMATGAELNAKNVVKVMLRSQPELVMRQKEADNKEQKRQRGVSQNLT
ncbi:hypothetical protein GEV33_000422 [Tenebrio molitor]|uniref:Uncharacterized protein n=1 Tax=Tenebrio molitor TaxID=7067 RepID=A0A8J6LGZ4_TENMO|nr:hypothetical protein GEV33_000422 [Tenebrio molitor]